MKYKVQIEKRVLKRLNKISDPYYTEIKTAILDLGDDPRPHGYIKLKRREGYRIRVGDYRIIYSINDEISIVNILNMGHRKDIYKF